MKKGFSLIEVLVAIGILAIVATAMFMFYPALFESTTLSSRTAKAFEIAKREMELLKATNFNQLYNVSYNPYSPGPTIPPNNFTITNFPNSSGVYYVAKVFDSGNNPTDDLVDVEVVVCFKASKRIIGEDTNLDGLLNLTSEDKNADKKINSAVSLKTLILKPQ